MAIPNSFGMESFQYFECAENQKTKIVVTMHFNALEQWDDPNSETPRNDGGEPDIIQRFWNSAMYFEWNTDLKQFIISKYTYDGMKYLIFSSYTYS